MVLYLREFEAFPANVVLTGDAEQLSVDFDCVKRVNDSKLELCIQKSGEEYFCQGTLSVSVRLECARCLREFDRDLKNETDFIVCSREQCETNKNIQDNEEYIQYQGTDLKVDLTDIVRQTIILSMSMKPLCSEDCRGLCPHCGINLNEKSCRCGNDSIDERWEGLKRLSGLTQKNKGITDASS